MAQKWVMVRLRTEAWERLNALRARLVKAYERGQRSRLSSADDVSLSSVVEMLLTEGERHMARGRACRRKGVSS